MKKVKFIQMKNGKKEDYLLLDKHEKKFQHSHLWSLIPLTRPIDTLIITLRDSEAEEDEMKYAAGRPWEHN